MVAIGVRVTGISVIYASALFAPDEKKLRNGYLIFSLSATKKVLVK